MIELESCPAEIETGDRIEVSGSVSDTISGLELAVFELPHGDVIAGPIRIRNGVFRSSLRLRKEGFYRLQILAELGIAHTETAVDRMLKVGSPDPLDVPTLSVGVYPEYGRGRRSGYWSDQRQREKLDAKGFVPTRG